MKSTKSMRGILAGAAAAVLLAIAPGAVDAAIYMKISGGGTGAPVLEGESTAEGFEKQIELQSIEWGMGVAVSRTSTGSGQSVGKPSFSEVTVSKVLDTSSPKMIEASAAGRIYRDVIISYTQSVGGGEEEVFYKVELKDVLISSYSTSSGGDRPTETLSLNFAAIKHTYTPRLPNGQAGADIVGQWNIITNTASFRGVEESTMNPVPEGDPPVPTGLEVTVEE